MSPIPESSASDPDPRDASRRTWLAAERTWLAWWRTGLGATAVAVGVGRILPGLAGGARWPLQLLGLGYGVLAIVVLLLGAMRHRQVAAALRRGSYESLASSLVDSLTAAGVLLGLATLVVVAIDL